MLGSSAHLAKKDAVTRTVCGGCQSYCGILAYTLNGKVVKLEGDPDNPRNRGHICAKGLSAVLSLYSPKRITRPLIRTNSEKGLGIDPKWKAIPWDEAIELVADRIKKVRESPVGRDPRKFLFATFDHFSRYGGVQAAWVRALPGTFVTIASSFFCGQNVHPPSFLNTSTFEITPDADYARYLLLLGSQAGSVINVDAMRVTRQIAEKRPGNVKVVVVDPVCSFAASRAEEWVPIRPGTDGMFILALVNLLVNEYEIYDATFLKEKTNAPYLIGPDGHYARDMSGKPLVWDISSSSAKSFDAPVGEYALQGAFKVNHVECKPAFQLLKDHVRRYTPEFASEVTTIPEETIRRIARELGEAACIGSSIVIDGVEVPYRPVSVVWYRGLSAHRHSYLLGLAALLLPTLLGAIQVPGGITGHPPLAETITEEGLLTTATSYRSEGVQASPYPPRAVVRPRRFDLLELFPTAINSAPMLIPVIADSERFGFKPGELMTPELMVILRENPIKNAATGLAVEALRKIPFIVSFALEPDETTNMADLVFPELHHLEKLSPNIYGRCGEPGYWYGAKPAVSPPFDPPYDRIVDNAQILLEIAHRAGFLSDVYSKLNEREEFKGTEYELDHNSHYDYLELCDRRLKTWLGPDKGLDWLLSDEGGLLVWGASVQERYKGAFRKARVHLYYEFMLNAGESVRKVADEIGLPWDTSDYQALPDWKPCPSFRKRSGEFDMFVINYKVPMMGHAYSRSNPLLRNLTGMHKLDVVLINSETASKKGISDGDRVVIETEGGLKTRGVAKLSERVHPEVIGTLQHSIGRGADFNSLLAMDEETVDFVACAVDSCLLAKIYSD